MGKLWLFDFDGTLVNSEKAIKVCYLKVGQELVPERCSFIDSMIIGPTLDESSRIILTDKNLHLLNEFKKRFQQLYDEKLVLETPCYPQVDKILKQLRSRGDHLYVITNKRKIPTYKLINHYSWHTLFNCVACMDEYPLAQDKSDLIKLKKIDRSQYDDIFFVGDTLNDYLAAKKNKIKFIKVNYGYGKQEDWSSKKMYKEINKIDELLKI